MGNLKEIAISVRSRDVAHIAAVGRDRDQVAVKAIAA